MFGPTTATSVPEAAKADTTPTPSVTCMVPGGDRGAPRVGCRAKAPHVGAADAKKGRPYAGAPSWVEVVGQRPLPKVGVTEPTVACCWMSCTQSW